MVGTLQRYKIGGRREVGIEGGGIYIVGRLAHPKLWGSLLVAYRGVTHSLAHGVTC